MLTTVTFGLAVALLLTTIVQTVVLVQMVGRVGAQADAQRRADTELAALRDRVNSLTERSGQLEERTRGSLNSATVAKAALPSVFRVRAGRATGTAFAFGQPPTGGGTLLVTNYHVVQDAVNAGQRTARIERASESYDVTIEKFDVDRDLAVLRAPQSFPRLTAARNPVQVGEPVVVVGAPLGLTDTVTTGVVSAVRDDVPGLGTRVIQFDAAINAGSSGGPVINAEGRVVGVARAKIVRQNADGLGLAIPISEVCEGLLTC